MRIVVINGTEQKGCSFQMKEMFLDIVGRGNTITEYYLPKDCPDFCTGCKACFYKDISVCPHRDYTVPVWDAIAAADLLVFVSPVYVFHATAQTKALLDHYASKWMAHSPDRRLFKKQAVIITNSAGMGMNNVIKDIGDSLRYWGVERIYPVKQALFESRWENIAEKRKSAIKRQCERINVRIKRTKQIKPGFGTIMRFYIMRMAQKMIHKAQIKAGQPETKDHKYWRENGWLGDKRPWKESDGKDE